MSKLKNSTLEKDDGLEDIEVTKIEIFGPSGIYSDKLHNKETAQIQIHYNAYQAMGKLQASVFIKRADGITCCMMRTALDDFNLFIDKGQGIISLFLEPLQLITGTYFVEAWFLNENDSMAVTQPRQKETSPVSRAQVNS